jgi:hypothetical protein
MAIEINVVNGIVNISTDGDVPRSYYGAVGASGSVMPMKAHLLGNVTELSWVSAQEYLIGAGIQSTSQASTSGLGGDIDVDILFTQSATSEYCYIESIAIVGGGQNGKYKIGDSVTFSAVGDGIIVTATVKSLEYQRLLIKIGGDFYEVNWFDLLINGTSPTDLSDALSLISSAFASVGSPYKVYSALLTQSGGSAPIATILQNTLGDLSFEYDGVGYYFINSSSLFTDNKTAIFFGNTNAGFIKMYPNNDSQLTIEVLDNSASFFDGGLAGTPIEIRVYN